MLRRTRLGHRHASALIASGLLFGAAPASRAEEPVRPPTGSGQAAATPASPAAVTAVQGGLSTHFLSWLKAHGFAGQNFERADLLGGSYGGRTDDKDPVVRPPVIFIHGNSDRAIGAGSAFQSGWTASIEFFLAKGYRPSELFAITWGPADPNQMANQAHSKAYLTRLRAFLQAVKDYTGAPKVSIVAHSMGVTLARKAILGGPGADPLDGGAYDLGKPLTPIIDTFVGIAGANRGLLPCALAADMAPACSRVNGFFPGTGPDGQGLSALLAGLNAVPHFEGGKVYSIWSTVDEIIGNDNLVWGQRTSPIPGQDGEKVFTSVPYGHINLKDLTARQQWRMVAFHEID
jgi:hypothetical protein